MKFRPYIICTPSYCVSSGVRVLHNLCHELNCLGFEAYLLLTANISPIGYPLINPDLKTPIINHLIKDHWQKINDNAIVIMSDGFSGNSIGAKRVVRYILGKEYEHTPPHPPEEYQLYYSRAFAHDHTKKHSVLQLIPVDLSLFNSNGNPARTQNMLWLGKGAKFCEKIPDNVVQITYAWPTTKQDLAAELRKTHFLYSYDGVSATNTEAVLCGAIVIFKHLSYHNNPWSRKDFEFSEIGIGGIAFDDTPEEIERARATIPNMQKAVREIVAEFRHNLIQFIEDTHTFFYR